MSERARLEGDAKPPGPLEWICKVYVVRVFDKFIQNFDRSAENLLIDDDWRVWMIDHTRAFKIFGQLRKEESLPPRRERSMTSASTVRSPRRSARTGGSTYALYADEWPGPVELEVLELTSYRVVDSVHDVDLGSVEGPSATLDVAFEGSLLVGVVPE